MALIVKGRTVSFDMTNGDEIDALKSHGMMHDPSGKYWKRTSVLIGAFSKAPASPTDGDKYSKDYLGHTHLTHVGDVQLPPRELSSWTYEGEVDRIWYTRTGKKNGGRRFQHQFNKAGLQRLFKGRGKARLYKHGAWYRLELPRNAQLDSRGFVHP